MLNFKYFFFPSLLSDGGWRWGNDWLVGFVCMKAGYKPPLFNHSQNGICGDFLIDTKNPHPSSSTHSHRPRGGLSVHI